MDMECEELESLVGKINYDIYETFKLKNLFFVVLIKVEVKDMLLVSLNVFGNKDKSVKEFLKK